MLIGLVVGTYSSVFVASPVVLYFDPESLKTNPAYNALIDQYNRIKKQKRKPTKKSTG